MKRLNAFVIALVLLSSLWPTVTVGQGALPPTPYHTVWGRLGAAPGDTGPAQAIPFAALYANLFGTQSANTVFAGPTSGGVATPTFRALTAADISALARIKATASLTYYVNGDNTNPQTCGTAGQFTGASACRAGVDSGNCLTPATACLTVQYVINFLNKSTDFAGFTASINGAHCTGANCTNYAFTCENGPWLGTSVIGFTGDSTAPTAVEIIPGAGNNGVAVKDGCTVGLSNFAFADNATNNAANFINVGLGNYGHVDVSTVAFGSCTLCAGVSVTYGGSVTFGDSGSSSTGGKVVEFLAQNGGVVDFGSNTYAGASTLTYTVFAEITGSGSVIATPSTFTGFSSISGPRCIIYGPYDFVTANPNAVFPGSSNCVPVVHGGAVGVPTGSGGSSSFNYGSTGQPLLSGGSSTANDTWGTLGIGGGGTGQTTLAGIQGSLQQGFLYFAATAVNFNATNGTDIAHFVITQPTGSTGWVMSRMNIFNCTAAITTAHVGIFDAAGASGNTITSNTAGTPTAQGPAAGTSLQQLTASTASSWYNSGNLYLNLIAQQGSAVTCSVTLWLEIL